MTRKRFDSSPQFNVKEEGVLIQQVAGSSTNLLEVKAHNGTTLMAVDYAGTMTSGASNTFTYLAATTSASLPANTTIGAVSSTELGYLDGVTSALQTQLDAKAPLASPTFTGTVTLPSGTVTSGMILDGTIVNGDINSAAAIAHSKLANATAGQVLLGTTTSGVITATTISGDITISGAGVATIQPDSVALGTDTTGNYVASLVAGTGITITNNTGEGATPTVTNSGVTGLTGTANQVTVSSSTGAVTISLPQNIHTGANPTFAGLTSTGNITVPTTSAVYFGSANGSNFWRPIDAYNNSYFRIATGSFYADAANYYFRDAGSTNFMTIGGSGTVVVTGTSPSIQIRETTTVANVDLFLGQNGTDGEGLRIRYESGTGHSSITNIFNGSLYIGTNNSIQITITSGGLISSGYIQAGNTGVTDTGSVSVTNWLRPVGNCGIYFQSYGGGFWMTDSTWIRSYGEKNVYFDREFRTNGPISANPTRYRGSYGSISIGGNGIANGWDGFEFVSSPQTFMVQGENYSGMFRNNNAWNWLWDYSTLAVGSDVRYKRDIQPLSVGLAFIDALEPISYLRLTESPDDDPEAVEPDYYYGFTAQNVRAALDAVGETRDVKIHNIGGPNMGLVACTEDAVYDRQYLGITEFIAPMVQAIKELKARVEYLESLNGL